MRVILSCLVLLTLFCKCDKPYDKTLENHKAWVIYLEDSLYAIEMTLPPELDTLYSWYYQSDNAGSALMKYRVTKKSFPIEMEPYFRKTQERYELTIEHAPNYKWKYDKYSKEDWKRFTYELGNKYRDMGYEIVFNRLTTFDNYEFSSIGGYDEEDKAALEYHTFIDGNPVTLRFECMAVDCTNFISRMRNSMKTIEITKR